MTRLRAFSPAGLAAAALLGFVTPAALYAQATQEQTTLPSPPSLQQPAPASQPPKAAGNPPAPSVNAPPAGTQPGEDRQNKGGGRGVVILPYADRPQGTATLELPGSGQGKAEVAGRGAELLDSVVAVINGDVILQSDVTDEQHFAVFQPFSVPGGRFTALEAMQHIISRSLILQQMREQQVTSPPTDEAVEKQIAELRKQIPACAQYHCETDAGWQNFLAANGFTVARFQRRWKQRMNILQFIELRFRSGIRISNPEIAEYYTKYLAPQYRARDVKPPPLAAVSPRIDEVLLQQRVNVLLQDWLKSLRDAGNVAILDPAYAAVGKPAAGGNGDDEDETPGGPGR